MDRVSFFICKQRRVIAVKTLSKKSAEKVDVEFANKILEEASERVLLECNMGSPLQQGQGCLKRKIVRQGCCGSS